MKYLLGVICGLLFCFVINAQELDYKIKKIPYYQRVGSVGLHFSNHMFQKNSAIMPVINFNTDVTVAQNFTLGPVFSFFQFKNGRVEAVNATRWTRSHIRYNQFLAGLKSTYHLNDLIQKMMKKPFPRHIVDVYAFAWGGYSFVFSKHKDADSRLMANNQKIRYGVGVGARTMVLKWFGFMIEGGYSSYGYASFGISFLVN